MLMEEYYDFDGCLILFDVERKREIGRIVLVPPTPEENRTFTGIVARDFVKIIEDKNTNPSEKTAATVQSG